MADKLRRAAKVMDDLAVIRAHKANLEVAYENQPHPDIRDLIIEKSEIESALKRELAALGHKAE